MTNSLKEFARVVETSTSTGTAAMTLAGAVSGFQAFGDVYANNNTAIVVITKDADWEISRVTYATAGNAITRTQVYQSTNADAAVNWGAGAKTIRVIKPGWSDLDDAGRASLLELLASMSELTVASASTCDILGAASLKVLISGVVPITSFGTGANKLRFVTFSGILILTHNATSLILPGGANITTAAGDSCIVVSDGANNARVLAYERASGYPVISAPGFRNIARRNGGFEIWQRGAGGAASIGVASSTTAYGPDGWYLKTNANQAATLLQTAGIVNGSQWAALIQRDSGQTGTGVMTFGFPLDTDELYPLLGQFVRLSFVAKAGAGWTPASGILTYSLNVGTATPVKFTTGYAGASVPITGAAALTSSAVRFQASSAAVISTNARQAEITFTWTPVGTAPASDNFIIDDVMLEIVSDPSQGASPFERLQFGEQLALCQRHFQKTFPYSVAPAQNIGADSSEAMGIAGKAGAVAGQYIMWRLPVTLRTSPPTITTYNSAAANNQMRDLGAGVDLSAITALSREVAIRFQATGNAATAVGNLLAIHATVDSGI